MIEILGMEIEPVLMFWPMFFLWLTSFVVSDYFRQRLPEQTPSGIGDFVVPTATEGRYVPLVFGTMQISGPNVIWYGDFSFEELTVTTGIIFKEDEVIGFKYSLGMQLGIMRGECAGIRRIWIGDEVVWDFVVDNGGVLGTVADVDKDDLFGGEKKGGGFVGRFRMFTGSSIQAQSSYLLLAKHGITNLPAYRGYTHIIMSNVAEDGGAEIGESNTLRQIKFEIQTYDTVANGGLGDSLGLGNDHHFIGDDLNPIVLAWDIFTNTDWGRSLSVSDLNQANFITTAETIFDEGLGFSLVQDTITNSGQLIDLIEQHVDGYIGPNPITGQIEIVLARQDYTLASEFQADETNVISVSKFSRGENNQTFNEMKVQYLDRGKNYADTYAPAQDLANLAIQGRPRSKTNRMPGVHTASAANKIAWRDLRGAARALASATVEINRTAWDLRPGKIISLTDDQVGIVNTPMRITAIRQGDPVSASLVLEVVEDIFGIEETGFVDPPPTEFVPPTLDVVPLAVLEGFAIDAPYRLTLEDQNAGGSGLDPRVYTGVRIGAGGQMTEYQMRVDAPKGGISPEFALEATVTGVLMTVGQLRNDEVSWQSGNGTLTMEIDPLGSSSPVPAGELDDLIGTFTPGGFNSLDGLAVISPGLSNEEWVIFTSVVDDVGGVRLESLYRGGLESNMETHTAGELIWFIWTGGSGISVSDYVAGQTFEVKLLPRSATSQVELDDSPEPISQADSTFADSSRAVRPTGIIEMSFNSQVFPSGDVDFDNIIPGSPLQVGISASPLIKPYFSAVNILQQVQGLFSDGQAMQPADFTNNNYNIEWWLFDLDTTPFPTRGVDEILSSGGAIPVIEQDGVFGMIKDSLSPTPTTNSFNARFEAQITFDPLGTVQANLKDLIFDFTAIGLFVVPRDTVIFQLVTEGELGSRQYRDISESNFNIVTMGDPATELIGSPLMQGLNAADVQINPDTAAGSGSQIFMIEDALRAENGKQWDMNQDWTFEITVQFDVNTANMYLVHCDQTVATQLNGETEHDDGHAWWGIFLDDAQDRFEFKYSTNGTSFSTASFSVTGEFVPVIGQTYRLMFTRKDNGDGTITMAYFVNGIKGATPQTVSSFTLFDFYSLSPMPRLFLTFARNQTFRTIVHSTASGFRGRIDGVRMILGFALELIDYTPITTEFPLKNTISLLVSTDVDGDGSVNPVITADGLESQIFPGASNGITMQPSPFPNSPEELYPCWDCTGVNSLTPTATGAPYLAAFPVGDRQESFEFARLDFQMEAWIYMRKTPVDNAATHDGLAIISKYNRPSGNTIDWLFQFTNKNLLRWNYWDGGGISSPSRILEETVAQSPVLSPIGSESPPRLVADRWYHVAVARNGDALSLWKDGVRVAHEPAFFSGSPPFGPIFNNFSNPIGIGRMYDASVINRIRCLDGFITDVRILIERTTYDGPTITVPTEPFKTRRGTVIANAKGDWERHATFLANWDDLGLSPLSQATDYGNIGFAISFFNNATIDTSVFKYGTGSLDLRQDSPVQDGNNYCQIPDNDVWDFDLKDFTLETWVRFNSLPAAGEKATFFGQWDISSTDAAWRFGYHGDLGFFGAVTTGNETTNMVQIDEGGVSPQPALNEWIHVRFTRRNLFSKLFVDGVQVAEGLMNVNPVNENEVVTFGASQNGAARVNFLDGWLDDSLIAIGHAKDDNQEFTPVRNFISHEVFHLGFDNDGFNWGTTRDESPNQVAAQVQSSMYWQQFPFMRRDGGEPVSLCWNATSARFEFTGNTGLNLEGEDFTIEMWMMWHTTNHLSGFECLLAHFNSSGNNQSWAIQYAGNPAGEDIGSPNLHERTLQFNWYLDGINAQNLSYQWDESPTLNTWHHIAYCREGDQLRLYIDGTRRLFDVYTNVLTSPQSVAASASPNGSEFPGGSPGTLFAPGSSADLTIGALQSSTNPADASFDGIRIIKGIAIYNADFTPVNKFPRI